MMRVGKKHRGAADLRRLSWVVLVACFLAPDVGSAWTPAAGSGQVAGGSGTTAAAGTGVAGRSSTTASGTGGAVGGSSTTAPGASTAGAAGAAGVAGAAAAPAAAGRGVVGGSSTTGGGATTSAGGAAESVGAAPEAAARPEAGAAHTKGAAASAVPSGGGRVLSKADVELAQRKLDELGYWGGVVDGLWDESWRHALVAFQKVEWRKRTGILTHGEWAEILRAQPPAAREKGPAHIEVDLARQVFILFDDAGVASHILPVSSGSGKAFRAPGWQGTADTPCGHFTVFHRSSGWHKSQLGEMYNPLYLVGGIAIHGSLDVPAKPVSHGCIRIPMYAAKHLPPLVPREMPVLVYGCKDDPPLPAVAARN